MTTEFYTPGRQRDEGLVEDFQQRLTEYLPRSEILNIKPTVVDTERRREYQDERPFDLLAMVHYEDRLVIVPSWHPLNTSSLSSTAVMYGTGLMETFTVEPGAKIVLLEPRLDRLFDVALPGRVNKLPVSRAEFTQGLKDYTAIMGAHLLPKSGADQRGSLRVTIGHGIEKPGKLTEGHNLKISIEMYQTDRTYPLEAYKDSGIVVSADMDQRFTEFKGKQSSKYGEIARIRETIKKLDADDAILFAPYSYEDNRKFHFLKGFSQDKELLTKLMLETALANGLGAEILALRSDGTLLLPPMSVNRLGGVTAEYLINKLAPDLGMASEIQAFSLGQVEKGEIIGLLLAGNSARVVPIGRVIMHCRGEILKEIYLSIPETVRKMVETFEEQVSGKIPPSDASLLTFVDIDQGKIALGKLKQIYKDWIG